MKRLALTLSLCMFLVPFLSAQTQPSFLATSDKLSFQDKNQDSIDLLNQHLPSVATANEQAEIYWRLSRDTLHKADDMRSQGAASDVVLAMYKQGEGYADRAIELDPSSAKGYYWKASNIGRWGQTRGILSSLFQADPMRKLLVQSATLDPSQGDAWFVLGQLYEQVPGFPLSFGNPVWAVSLGRKAVDARTAEWKQGTVPDVPEDYFIQLANHLAKRNWSAAKRLSEHPAEAQKYSLTTDVVEKNFYYEGSVSTPNLSDKQEAVALVQTVVDTLQAVADRTAAQNRDLKNAQDDLSSWSH